jgi:hypothetical protein
VQFERRRRTANSRGAQEPSRQLAETQLLGAAAAQPTWSAGRFDDGACAFVAPSTPSSSSSCAGHSGPCSEAERGEWES